MTKLFNRMSNTCTKFDLGWGDPVVVRQALFKFYIPNIKTIDQAFSYVAPYQYNNLSQNCRKLNRRLFGRSYQYVAITTGAMQAIHAICDYYKRKKYTSLKTDNLYFPYYPEAAKRNGLVMNSRSKSAKHIRIIDSPSNPKGSISSEKGFFEIWDAAYNNDIYKSIITPPLNAEVVVGSFGKLFGLSGFRLGWIATDNKELQEHIEQYVETNTCSLPTPSIVMLNEVISRYWDDWGVNYEILAKRYIDNNRTELSSISNIFDGQEISPNGMFYFPKADKKAREILKKAGVKYVEGSGCGDSESIRLNIAQDNDLMRKAVNQIKRIDLCQKKKKK